MIALIKIYWLSLQITLLSFGGIYSFWAILDREAVRACPQASAHAAPHDFTICRDDFNTVFILSKIVPGPHVNLAAMLGYPEHGVAGMLVLLLGLLTPGLVFTPLVFRFYRRYRESPRLRSFFRGASLASIALLGVFLGVILMGQVSGEPVRLIAMSGLFAGSFWLSYRFRLNPMVAVICGGIFGFFFLQ